jgi:hypothetical protein
VRSRVMDEDVYVGIDVSKTELVVVVRKNSGVARTIPCECHALYSSRRRWEVASMSTQSSSV